VSLRVTHAMILAAGRGERLRPLTDSLPKPLAVVRGKPLIVHHLEKLARLGVHTVVINLSWLGATVREALGDGALWGLSIHYSDEGPQPLDVGGGIFRALPALGSEPFLTVSADIYSSFDFSALVIAPQALAQLLLVPNPEHHRGGDFALIDGRVAPAPEPAPALALATASPAPAGQQTYTFGGIALMRARLFEGCQPGRFPLLPLLERAMAAGRLHGQLYDGEWVNVGTAAQLAALQ
jgi:N-acetyl-alpha-D-muramate 1-phosphate uridylyltransferase